MMAAASLVESKGPWNQHAVRIGRIGCRDRDRHDFVALVPRIAQQIDRAGLRELRRAEAGHEIAAPDAAGFFEPAQHRIQRREPAGQLLDRRHIARHHAVPRQQLMRHRRRPRRCGAGRGRHQRPSPFGRRRHQAPRSKRAAPRVPPRALRRRRIGAQRVQRVVGQQASPHQIPDRIDCLLREAAADGVVQRSEERRARDDSRCATIAASRPVSPSLRLPIERHPAAAASSGDR